MMMRFNLNAKVANLTKMFGAGKEPTLKEFENLYSKLGYVTINAIGQCSYRSWGTPQFNIIDYEIIERNNYYF